MKLHLQSEDLANGRTEWLETDGLGGFAMGSVDTLRRRRYHGLLASAATPPTGRKMLVAGLEVWVEAAGESRSLSLQRYLPGVNVPAEPPPLVAFDQDPWPRWTYRLPGGLEVVCELALRRGLPLSLLRWRTSRPASGLRLCVRPLLAARDVHALQRESSGLDLHPLLTGERVAWRPDPALPGVLAWSNGRYEQAPCWYRQFLYEEERERGFDHVEDLAAPGVFVFELGRGPACLALAAESEQLPVVGPPAGLEAGRWIEQLLDKERERRARCSAHELAAEHYLVRRGEGASLIAGYPWFTDWGRDTFLSLRGLLLATGRLEDAGRVLRTWASALDRGMLPNRFVEGDEAPEYHSVDAALWFAVSANEYVLACERTAQGLAPELRLLLRNAVAQILEHYCAGTRYGIAADEDGLLHAGEAGWQLTWMDAKVEGQVITPRSGKPVEVQALWIHALAAGAAFDRRWRELELVARRSFAERFWNEAGGYLYDVIDVDGRRGEHDASLRPNQILAVGGLPTPLLEGPRARAVVEVVHERLWTPLGLRSLERADPRYVGRYAGSPSERDRAYHQGTVWPWLAGPFIEAWVRVHGDTEAARAEARARFLAPLVQHRASAGLGHVSEIADGDHDHRPGGAPFQAWSLAELLRVEHGVLAAREPERATRAGRARTRS